MFKPHVTAIPAIETRIFPSSVLLDYFKKTVDYLAGRHSIGVQHNSIVGFHKRTNRTCGVTLVALVLFFEHFVERYLFAASNEVVVPTFGPDSLAGSQKDLALGAWKYHGTLIAALSDEVLPLGSRSLQLD